MHPHSLHRSLSRPCRMKKVPERSGTDYYGGFERKQMKEDGMRPDLPEESEQEENGGEEEQYRCLMVTTGREESTVRLMNAIHLGRGIVPKRIRVRRVRGEWLEDEAPMLPGYVFIREETEIPIQAYQRLQDVIRVLRYDQEPNGYMRARDLRFARALFRMEGVVSPLKAVDEGDRIRITDGMLRDMNGTVLSVDRHKRQAKVRLDLMGMSRVICMNYVLLEKEEQGTDGPPDRAEAAPETGLKGENGK